MQGRFYVAFALVALAACGGGATTGGKGDPTKEAYPEESSALDETMQEGVGAEGADVSEATGVDITSEVVQTCASASDCASGLCVPSASGMVCTEGCPKGQCPDGFVCWQGVSGAPPVCVPADGILCWPCRSDDDCKPLSWLVPGHCVEFSGGKGSFCLIPCETGPCPAGFACRDDGLCGPEASVCECNEVAKGLGLATDCYRTNQSGTCHGTRRCGPEGLGECDAPVPGPEACNGLDDDCDGQTDEDTCDDNNPCTVDTCDKGCVHSPADLPCDDHDQCTLGDHCVDGECRGGQSLDCDDGNVCTTDSCDRTVGCVHVQNHDPCSDGDPCTVGDHCQAGVCIPGDHLVCDDGNVCTDDRCEDGGCVHEPLSGGPCEADQNGCTVGDHCEVGQCVPGQAADCSGLKDACNDGVCVSHGADSYECIRVWANEGAPCDDGLFCTDGESCFQGTCQGGIPIDCSTVAGPCAVGQCNEELKKCEVKPVPDGIPCEDGDGCTEGDTCAQGKCAPGPRIDCSRPDDPCNTWGCVSLGPLSHACEPTPLPSGTLCDDHDACTRDDACDGKGNCVGDNAVDCSALSGMCGKGVCDKATGDCKTDPYPDGTPCDDSDPCTLIDACTDGVCRGTGTACGDLKVSEGPSGYSGQPPVVIDLGSGRTLVAWLENNIIRGRSIAQDGSREGQETVLAEAAMVGRPLVAGLPQGAFAVGTYAAWNSCSCQDCKDMGTECVAGVCNSVGSIPHKKCSWQQWNTITQRVWSAALEANPLSSFTLYSNSGTFMCQECPTQPGWVPLAFAGLSDGNLLWLWRRDADNAVLGRIVRPDWSLLADLGTLGQGWSGGVAVAASLAPGGGFLLAYSDGNDLKAEIRNSAGVRTAGPFMVPTTTTGAQVSPAAAYLPTGGYVVAWVTDGVSGTDVAYQVLAADGTKVGTERAAATLNAGNQAWPAVAAWADGTFAIVWQDDGGSDGSGKGVFARTFAADGKPVTEARAVPYETGGDQVRPAAAVVSDMLFVAWYGADGAVYARKLSKDNLPVRPVYERLLNWTRKGDQGDPAIAALPSGGFVATWTSVSSVVYRLLDANGAASMELLVGDGARPSVAVAPDGPFLVAYLGPSGGEVLARRFGATGEAGGDAVTVAKAQGGVTGFDRCAATGMASGFAVAYATSGGAGRDVAMRCLDPAGQPVGAEVFVDQTVSMERTMPALASGPSGYLAVWQARKAGFGTFDVYARPFGPTCVPSASPVIVGTGGTADPKPAVAALPLAAGGGFVVIYVGLDQAIMGQRLGPDGTKLGSPVLIASGNTAASWTSLTALASGAYIVAWEAVPGDEAPSAVLARKVGTGPEGLVRVLNLTYKGSQGSPALASSWSGGPGFLAAWRSQGQDGDSGAIVARLFPGW